MSSIPVRIAAVLLATALGGCVITTDPDPPRQRAQSTSAAATPSSSASSAGTGATPPEGTGISLVEVDTDQVLKAAPGEGVGVFVEYKKGGQWHVWWTCDTAQSQQACAFTIDITSEGGDLTEVKQESFASGESFVTTGASGEAFSTVTTEVKGVTFETTAGGIVRVKATVEGIASANSSFLFFVQDGKVNGGYSAALPNPLRFVGKTP